MGGRSSGCRASSSGERIGESTITAPPSVSPYLDATFIVIKPPKLWPMTKGRSPSCAAGHHGADFFGAKLRIVVRSPIVKPAPLTPGKVQGQADCFISYPLYSTMSKIIIFESGSRSGDGSSSFLTNISCLPASPALLRNGSVLLYGSPSKYICVTILSCRPLTWKWICAGLIRLGPAG